MYQNGFNVLLKSIMSAQNNASPPSHELKSSPDPQNSPSLFDRPTTAHGFFVSSPSSLTASTTAPQLMKIHQKTQEDETSASAMAALQAIQNRARKNTNASQTSIRSFNLLKTTDEAPPTSTAPLAFAGYNGYSRPKGAGDLDDDYGFLTDGESEEETTSNLTSRNHRIRPHTSSSTAVFGAYYDQTPTTVAAASVKKKSVGSVFSSAASLASYNFSNLRKPPSSGKTTVSGGDTSSTCSEPLPGLEEKWLQLITMYHPEVVRRSKKARKLIKFGIPNLIRGRVWRFLALVDRYYRPGVYQELLKREPHPIYDAIQRDVERSYPNHSMFSETNGEGQENMFNVLKAYAQYNPEVGYCQGMGRVVGMMLMHMSAEEAFWLLVATIDQHMTDYYSPNLSRLKIDSEVLGGLLGSHYPRLAQHLSNNDVLPLMYVTPWFLTLYTQNLPWPTVLRIWDVFYFDGSKVIFRVALGILDVCKDHLLLRCPTNSEILEFLLHLPQELLSPEIVLEAAYRVRLRRSEIERWTKRATEKFQDILALKDDRGRA